MTDPIRVFVVDDHPVVRRGLTTFLDLQEDIEVLGEAGDAEEALDRLETSAPDVLLTDLVMPGTDGVELIRTVRERFPGVVVVVLTSFAGEEKVLPALRAGAAGYLLKDAEPDRVADAIRSAAAGGAPLDPSVASTLLSDYSSGPSRQTLPLTARESEVLTLLAEGLSNRLIARRLSVSEKTVKTHVSAILTKLGVESRTQAAMYAVREGLIGSGPTSEES